MSKHNKAARPPGGPALHEKGFGDLSDAALALEQELQRFEELVGSARKMPLDTQKSIERAAKTTTEAASGQERVNASLHALVTVITAARERHEANAAALTERGEEIRLRAVQLEGLYEQYAALGEEGKLINELVQEVAAQQRDVAAKENVHAIIATIERIDDRMGKLVDGARSLAQASVAASITDLAEQADSLRQQVAAARNKMGLLKSRLKDHLPDPSQLN